MAARHNTDGSSSNSTLQTITPGAVNASNTDFISTTRDAALKAKGHVHALQQENNLSDVPEDNVVTYENSSDSILQFTRAEVETASKTDFQENVSTAENTNTLDTYALKTNKNTENKNRHAGLSKIHNDDEESVKRDLGTIKKNIEGISDGTVISGNEKTTENVVENVVKEQEGISKTRRADEKLKNVETFCHDTILSMKEITKNNFESSSPKNMSKANCDKEKDAMYNEQHTSHHVVGKKDERQLVYYPANATSVFDRHESHVTTGTHEDGNVAYRAGCVTTRHLTDVTVTRGKANYAMFLNILPQSGNVLQLTRETSSSSLKENQAQLEIGLDDFVEISLEVKKYLITMLSIGFRVHDVIGDCIFRIGTLFDPTCDPRFSYVE